jgi:hypothetical protein
MHCRDAFRKLTLGIELWPLVRESPFYSGRSRWPNERVGSEDGGMKQTSFASLEYAGKKCQTRREQLPGEMELETA